MCQTCNLMHGYSMFNSVIHGLNIGIGLQLFLGFVIRFKIVIKLDNTVVFTNILGESLFFDVCQLNLTFFWSVDSHHSCIQPTRLVIVESEGL